MRKQLVGEINYIKVWQRRINTTSGTKIGGLKAAATNKELHGDDFYARIGQRGGKFCGLKGFALNPELAKIAGAKGGKISKRGKVKQKTIPF